MSDDLTKQAVKMLLNGATLLSEPCPYCKGVRVMKDGDALCVNCGKKPDIQHSNTKLENKKSIPSLIILEKKLEELSNQLAHEDNLEKQQKLLKTINALIETIRKLKPK
jgi:UPF0148 protein